MKHFNFLFCFLLASFLMLGCDDDTIQPDIKQMTIIGELPVYYEALSDSSLIVRADLGGQQFTGCMINSTEELKSQLGKEFLKSYPAYETIDFDQYTLLVRTAIVRNNILARHSSFNKLLHSGRYNYHINHVYKNMHPIVPYVERTAIIVYKLDKDATIVFSQNSTAM